MKIQRIQRVQVKSSAFLTALGKQSLSHLETKNLVLCKVLGVPAQFVTPIRASALHMVSLT